MEILEPEYSELIDWIIKRQKDQITRFTQAEALLKEMPGVEEAKALVIRLSKSINYYSTLVEEIEKLTDSPQQESGRPRNKNSSFWDFGDNEEILDDDDEATFEDNEEMFNDNSTTFSNASEERKNPKDFMRLEFQGKSQEDAIQSVLERYEHPLNIEEVAMLIYDIEDCPENLKRRAKDSIAVALRSGVESGKWQKVDRGVFATHSIAQKINAMRNGNGKI